MVRRVAIIGASGLIGSGLAAMLKANGYHIDGLSRRGSSHVEAVASWSLLDSYDFSRCHAVVNLAGEPIDQRWNTAIKQRLVTSRVDLTAAVVKRIAELPEQARPRVLINASAVGYYGDRGDEELPETATPGTGFLAELCRRWEQSALAAGELGLRVVPLRIGIVLGREARAFVKLKRVFRYGLGGRLGSGTQWMPWIHLTDLQRMIIHILEHEAIASPINGTAPHPVRNADFTTQLARACQRWEFVPVPRFALRIAFGEFGNFLLSSQRTVTARLEASGFEFVFPRLESALMDLLPPQSK